MSLFFLAVLAAPSAVANSPLEDLPRLNEAASRLAGQWQGDDYVLRIDSTRDQASTNPAKPFEWRRFLVKEASGREIVFTVGAELFEAKLVSDVLVLTSTSFRGERKLRRAVADATEAGAALRGTLTAAPDLVFPRPATTGGD